jgi:hypothetical protein
MISETGRFSFTSTKKIVVQTMVRVCTTNVNMFILRSFNILGGTKLIFKYNRKSHTLLRIIYSKSQ